MVDRGRRGLGRRPPRTRDLELAGPLQPRRLHLALELSLSIAGARGVPHGAHGLGERGCAPTRVLWVPELCKWPFKLT